MKATSGSKSGRQARKSQATTVDPVTVNPGSKSRGDGPTAAERPHEGPSVGRASRSTAAGAAGQLTPKDER